MSVNSVAGNTPDYSSTYTNTTAAKQPETTATKTEDQAAVYEKTTDSKQSGTIYSKNKMSEKDRAALVNQLKADLEARQNNLVNIVKNMMSKQSKTFSVAQDENAMWKFLASGDFTVDAATKAQAQKDIAEDGYWGVKQTSQRLFDFASALAGDDVDKMKKMQEAMKKGFDQATGAWGRSLPGICSDTMDAANKLFEDYYASKKTEEVQ